ncbi:hypothetical protein KY285_007659 [Solanum tuberosum]|nr:hypothetical protein KY285_007659 [Solanum tuberosum]
MGLNETFSHVRSDILLKSVVPNVNQAYAIVVQEESQRFLGVVNLNKEPLTMMARRGQSFKGRRFTGPIIGNGTLCMHCGHKGHRSDDCYRVVGYPVDFKTKMKSNNGNQTGSGNSGQHQTGYGGYRPRGNIAQDESSSLISSLMLIMQQQQQQLSMIIILLMRSKNKSYGECNSAEHQPERLMAFQTEAPFSQDNAAYRNSQKPSKLQGSAKLSNLPNGKAKQMFGVPCKVPTLREDHVQLPLVIVPFVVPTDEPGPLVVDDPGSSSSHSNDDVVLEDSDGEVLQDGPLVMTPTPVINQVAPIETSRRPSKITRPPIWHHDYIVKRKANATCYTPLGITLIILILVHLIRNT